MSKPARRSRRVTMGGNSAIPRRALLLSRGIAACDHPASAGLRAQIRTGPTCTRFRETRPCCMVKLYTKTITMAADKSVSMSFRVSPRFKALLEVAAARENRSLTNMLETLVFAHCEQHGLSVPPAKVSQGKGAKK